MKTLYFNFHNNYDHQIWQSGNSDGGLCPTSHVTFWPCGDMRKDKLYIWSCAPPMATKLVRVLTQSRGNPIHQVMWIFDHVVTRQLKNDIYMLYFPFHLAYALLSTRLVFLKKTTTQRVTLFTQKYCLRNDWKHLLLLS